MSVKAEAQSSRTKRLLSLPIFFKRRPNSTSFSVSTRCQEIKLINLFTKTLDTDSFKKDRVSNILNFVIFFYAKFFPTFLNYGPYQAGRMRTSLFLGGVIAENLSPT